MPKRGPHYSQEERVAILKEGEKTSFNAVRAKYNISPQTYRRWRYMARGIKPKPARHFPDRRKLQILEEGYQNGIGVACKRRGIDPSVYFYWKHKFSFTKSRPRCLHTFPRFSTEQKLAILKEGEKPVPSPSPTNTALIITPTLSGDTGSWESRRKNASRTDAGC